MKIAVIIIFLLLNNFIFSQNLDKYEVLIEEAYSLYESGNYLESGKKYSSAFSLAKEKAIIGDRYDAACSWSLANQIDSAYEQLFIVGKSMKFKFLDHIKQDSDLDNLRSDKRWMWFVELIRISKEKSEENYDKELVTILDTIYHKDQDGRHKLDEVAKEFGRNSKEIDDLWDEINYNDSLDLIVVSKILDERGWLGSDVIGNKGNTTLFLVIQHADIETQKKYLPMMREAVKNGNAQGGSLALLEDRVALRTGKLQIYGSQIGTDRKTGEHYVLPLIDPDNVNQRRKSVGLGTIEDYISIWEMTWDVEEYKKKLPEILKERR